MCKSTPSVQISACVDCCRLYPCGHGPPSVDPVVILKVMDAAEEFGPIMVRLEHLSETQREIAIDTAPEGIAL